MIDTLKEVKILDKRNKNESGVKTIERKQIQTFQNTTLQNVLHLQSNVFVKNYGVGALSTISMRGSSAAQTNVEWNGIQINSAMSGITDFSLISTSLFDQIKIKNSSETPHVIGGNIELNNIDNNNDLIHEYKMSDGIESIKNISATLGIKGFYTKKIKFYLKLSGNRNLNSFSFLNPISNKYDTLNHAKSILFNLLLGTSININKHTNFHLNMWSTISNRQIPPTIYETKSVKIDTSITNRVVASFNKIYQQTTWITSLGLIFENYKYADSTIHFYNNSKAINIPFSQKAELFLRKNQKISIQANANYQQLLNNEKQNVHKASLLIQYEIEPLWQKIFIKTFAQKEISNIFILPYTMGFSIKGKMYKQHFIYANISSNYRTPTLNELYFSPGGNINLKPETSRNIEAGMENKMTINDLECTLKSTLYNRDVKNWIVWFGGTILTPHNIQKVWSRGTDLDAQFRFRIDNNNKRIFLNESEFIRQKIEHKKYLQFGILYAYTLSTTKASDVQNDYSIGKQIPYVPRYQTKINIGYEQNNFSFNYIYSFTGYRFVTTDETQFLLPYNTHNIFASYTPHLNNSDPIVLRFSLYNLLNKNYESVLGRMMPTRYLSASVDIRL